MVRNTNVTVALLLIAAMLAQGLPRPEAYRRARDLTALGRQLFFDPALSASGRESCATCHDPKFAYGPPPGLKQPGRRAIPSLRYIQTVPQFTEHYFDESAGDDSVDRGPTGGLTWDGRVDRGRDQARIPLLAPEEMANTSADDVAAHAMKRPYAPELRRLRDGTPFGTILEALEAFEENPKEFYPYSSRYDEYLAGKAKLSEGEMRGLRIFSDSEKGNCASCHPAGRGIYGTPPQFTDYGYANIGLPDADDPGLCGHLAGHTEYCGMFRAPTLRNAAVKSSFFHNGAVHSLREAVRFYAKRDDARAHFQATLEKGSPFDRKPGLTDEEIDDIVAFLQTLTDR
ncbi:MAG: c-type cytochrome [Acidobacteriota bacterium]|nr:c-type cytochrome [Acidobacteriota bacterium]